jgi:hypothetical protein
MIRSLKEILSEVIIGFYQLVEVNFYNNQIFELQVILNISLIFKKILNLRSLQKHSKLNNFIIKII